MSPVTLGLSAFLLTLLVFAPVVSTEVNSLRHQLKTETEKSEEVERTGYRELEGLPGVRVQPSTDEEVLQHKELKERVSQDESLGIWPHQETQKKKTETLENEIKLISEKIEEEKQKLAQYKQYATSLLHEKQMEISNLKDTIEVMERNVSGTKTPLLSPLDQEDPQKLHHQINVLKKELEESKKMSELLFLQQDVLKEEIRRLERAQKREGNFNLEYLKNILLKYMQPGNHEGLVPVIAEILQFSPEEVASVTKRKISTGHVIVKRQTGTGHVTVKRQTVWRSNNYQLMKSSGKSWSGSSFNS